MNDHGETRAGVPGHRCGGGAASASTPLLTSWKSWAEAKKGYTAAYKHHLAALAKRAAQSWKIEDLIAKFEEGIHAGASLTVPLLKPGKAELAGDGAKIVTLTPLDQKPPAVRLTAADVTAKGEVAFELHITYDDATSEELKFFVVPKGTPSNHRSVLPHFTPRPGGI